MAVSADSVLRLLDRRERSVFATFALARTATEAEREAIDLENCVFLRERLGDRFDATVARFALGDRVRVSVSGVNLVRGWIDFALLEHPGAEAFGKKGRAPG